MQFLIARISTHHVKPPSHEPGTISSRLVVCYNDPRRTTSETDFERTCADAHSTTVGIISVPTSIISHAITDWPSLKDPLPESASCLDRHADLTFWFCQDHPYDLLGAYCTVSRILLLSAILHGRIAWVPEVFPSSDHEFANLDQTQTPQANDRKRLADTSCTRDDTIIPPTKPVLCAQHLTLSDNRFSRVADREFRKAVTAFPTATEPVNAESGTWSILDTDLRLSRDIYVRQQSKHLSLDATSRGHYG